MRSSVRSRSPPPMISLREIMRGTNEHRAPTLLIEWVHAAAATPEVHRQASGLFMNSWNKNSLAVLLFNKTEEVKRFGSAVWNRNTGFDCIDVFDKQKGRMRHKRVNCLITRASKLNSRIQGYRVKRTSACGGCLGDHRR